MLDKSKGPVLRKLRTIQLIEMDLQIIMRIEINTCNRGKIEQNKRVSKSNYRSRLKYCIEMAILKKSFCIIIVNFKVKKQ